MPSGLALKDILADARIRDIALGDQPGWVWDVWGSCIPFANAGAVALFGAADLASLRGRSFGEEDPVGRQIRRVAETLPGDGGARMAMLRLSSGGQPVPTACRCRLFELEGRRLVLVVAVGGVNDTRPLSERLEAVFREAKSSVVASLDGDRIFASPAAEAGGAGGDRPTLRFVLPSSAGEVLVELSEPAERAGQGHLHVVPDVPDAPVSDESWEEDLPVDAVEAPSAVAQGSEHTLDAERLPAEPERPAGEADVRQPGLSHQPPSAEAPKDAETQGEDSGDTAAGPSGGQEFLSEPVEPQIPAAASDQDQPPLRQVFDPASALFATAEAAPAAVTAEAAADTEAGANGPEREALEPTGGSEGQDESQPQEEGGTEEETAIRGDIEAEDEGAGDIPAEPDAPTEKRSSPQGRFTFALDADGTVTEVGPALRGAVGDRAAVAGRRWQDLSSELALDPHGEIERMFETRDTWSGVIVEWPREEGGRVGVRLAALPRFGERRQFLGYRGFGEILEGGVASAAPAVSEKRIEEDVPEPQASSAADTSPPPVEESQPAEVTPPQGEEQVVPPSAIERPDAPTAGEGVGESNVHHLHPGHRYDLISSPLNERERSAFHAIARVLGARLLPGQRDEEPSPADVPEEAQESDTAAPADTGEEVDAHAELQGQEVPPPGEGPDIETPVEPVAESHEPASSEPHASDVEVAEAEAEAQEQAPGPATIAPAAELDAHRLTLDLLAHLPVGLGVVRDEELIYANRAFLDIFGFTDIDDLDIAGGLAMLFEGRSTREAGGATVRARHRDGSPMEIEARLSRVGWVDGPAMLLAVRRPEPVAELRGEIEKLRTVVELASDGTVVLDRDWRVLEVNQAGHRLLGGDTERLVGRPFLSLVPDNDRAIAEDYLDGLTSRRGRILLDDGVEFVLDVDNVPLPVFVTGALLEQAGEASVCLVLRDLRRWKTAEAEALTARRRAEQANEKKSDFLAKMSHEIRTPLNAIIGFAEVMLEERFGPLGNERYRDYLADVRESGEHIMSLINDLLDLSKVEAGRMDLTFTGVKLNDIVEQTVAIMQPQANRQRVIIRTSLPMGVPPIVADSRSLRQVMMNLLSNGIKFTPAGGQVIVSTMITDEGDVSLRVRDTGVGMTEAETEVALEPFRQVGARNESSVKGSGLGLPLTKALVEANRAHFAIRSRPSEGTLVEITFPQSRVLAE